MVLFRNLSMVKRRSTEGHVVLQTFANRQRFAKEPAKVLRHACSARIQCGYREPTAEGLARGGSELDHSSPLARKAEAEEGLDGYGDRDSPSRFNPALHCCGDDGDMGMSEEPQSEFVDDDCVNC